MVRRYVIIVAATGASAAVAATALGANGSLPAAAWPLVLATVLSVWVPLRFQHRGGVQGFTLDEALLVALLFVVPWGWVAVLHASAVGVAHLLRRTDLLKVAFNTGQIGLASAAAALTFGSLASRAAAFDLRHVGAAVAATAAYNVVNSVALAELFRRLEGRSYTASFDSVWRLNAVTWVGNTSFGLLLAYVALDSPLAAVLASTLMVGLFLGYRGYAGMLEERQRADRLHTLTSTLADVDSSDATLQRFLSELRSIFGADGAALSMYDSDRVERLVLDGSAVPDAVPCPALLEAVEKGQPRILGGDARPAWAHRDALSAPVVYEGRTVGAIAVYDRYGLEPWDETDATLLGTIANEAAVALKNVELFATVERERALLAEESRKLSDIVDNASDGIAMVEADGRVAAWNDAMAQITGLPASQTFGQPWFMVLRLRDRNGTDLVPEGNNALAGALRGEGTVEELELQVLRRDGQWRWLRCSVSPIERSGLGVVGAVLLARDVTREHEVEELKGDFIATVSHELRTPLTPLRGFLDTLVAKGHQLDPEQVTSIYSAMRGQVTRLERLVGDLLLVADVERRELGLRVEAVDLVPLVAEAVARIQPPIEDGRLHVQAPEWLGAVCDDAAVVRILSSLIDNAAKHTSGAITVRLAREGDRAVVEIGDEGPGIAPWDQELVFQRFGRLGNHLHRTQGPGLGLPIARALARGLDGDVTVTSDVGHGATFRLDLPASAPRVVRTTTPESAEHHAG